MYKNIIILLLFPLLAWGCAAKLPQDYERSDSRAYSDTRDTPLGKAAASQTLAHPGKSGFHLLGNGLDAFVARVLLARQARRSLDVQYYLYHDDLVGRLLTDQLIKAADRGVRVRLLVDDMDLEGRDMGAAALDLHPNMEVRIFNPFSRDVSRSSQFITRLGSVTRRMHNKSFTADNQATILGGRNIGNAYFEAHPDLAFADLDVMVIGPAVQSVSTAFDKYWNNALSYPAAVLAKKKPTRADYDRRRQALDAFIRSQWDSAYLNALSQSGLARKIRKNELTYSWGEARVVYDQPEKIISDFDRTEFHLAPQIKSYWENVKQELIVFSPYFVPGKAGTAFLTDLVEKGVAVKILTNSLASTDVSIVHSGYARYRKPLLRGGVQLYEMSKKQARKSKTGLTGSSKASLHAKSFVFDREIVFIGSLNLDPRSVIHNTEIGVLFSAEDLGRDMGGTFDRIARENAFSLKLVKNKNGTDRIVWHGIKDGEPVTFDTEPYTGFWKRLGVGLMGLLPIESQL